MCILSFIFFTIPFSLLTINSSVLTKPNHKLTLKKCKVIDYELKLEEKKETLSSSISSNDL